MLAPPKYFLPSDLVTSVHYRPNPHFLSRRSLATYDDVMTYFNHSMLKSHHTPSTRLSDIMQRKLITASPDDTLADLHARGVFQKVSGLPVTREDGTLVGVISRKDMEKPGQTVRVS